MEQKELQCSHLDNQSNIALKEMMKVIIQSLTKNDKNYPSKLLGLSSSPETIYFIGDISILENKVVAVIGKREATEKELQVSKDVGYYLAQKGYTVLNGLAIGCDKSAIEGALKAKGKVVAVMPSGLDTIYPSSCKKLAEEIVKNGGCLISEYPIGTKPEKYRFIERDRIQAGLSNNVCVIATDKTGGTMHTVNYSIDNGKNIVCYIEPSKGREGNKWLVSNRKCKPFTSRKDLLNSIESEGHSQQ